MLCHATTSVHLNYVGIGTDVRPDGAIHGKADSRPLRITRRIAFAAQDDVLIAYGNPGPFQPRGACPRPAQLRGTGGRPPHAPVCRFPGAARSRRRVLHRSPRHRDPHLSPRYPVYAAWGVWKPIKPGRSPLSSATARGRSSRGSVLSPIGMVTIEQAFINYSSVFHSTFVKYLEDLLTMGFACRASGRLSPPSEATGCARSRLTA